MTTLIDINTICALIRQVDIPELQPLPAYPTELLPKLLPFGEGFDVTLPALTDEEDIDPGFSQPDAEEMCDRLIAAALKAEYVSSARAFECEGKYVLATLTSPFFQKSERDRARQLLETQLRELAGDKVFVTFSTDIFRRIRPDMSDAERKALYDFAINNI